MSWQKFLSFGFLILIQQALFASCQFQSWAEVEINLQLHCELSRLQEFKNIIFNLLLNGATYDYIIVGGGTAGSALAYRLSEKYTVALLEAGGYENALSRIPAMAAYNQLYLNWDYKTVPQKCACFAMNDNQCTKPMGRVLGGSSSVNLMLYMRGNHKDHNCPRLKYNVPGWDADTCQKYILKSERAFDLGGAENTEYHNKNGKLSVRHQKYETKINQAYIEAMQQMGVPLGDTNGKCQLSVNRIQTTTNEQGQRVSAYRAYLQKPAASRKNLKIFTNSEVYQIIFNQQTKEVSGVRFRHLGLPFHFKARKEVIISAGVFNSAKLLMLSGIGPQSCLNKVGITQRHDLPVGKSMTEHTTYFGPIITVNTTGESFTLKRLKLSSLLRYAAGHDDTVLSIPIAAVESVAFIQFPNSTNAKGVPDVEFLFASSNYNGDLGTGIRFANNIKSSVYRDYYAPVTKDNFVVLMTVMHPHSKGYMCLKSSKPSDAPLLEPNVLGDDRDVELLYKANKFLLKLIETPAMKKLDAKLYSQPFPGCEHHRFGSKCYWKCVIRSSVYMYNHEQGTCRMGCRNDPGAVVDYKLRVHGMKNLRVIDNSAYPCTVAGHTYYLALMIAERAADFILNDDGIEEECIFSGQPEVDAEQNVGKCTLDCNAEDEADDDDDDNAQLDEDFLNIAKCEA